MTPALAADPIRATPCEPKHRRAPHAKPVYAALLRERGGEPGRIDELARSASRSFLLDRLDAVAGLTCDFPDSIRSLPAWLDDGNRESARRYRDYLDGRQAGAPRRFFASRSHALHFLRAVAPTKLVDGAWLYGLLPHWADARLAPLVRIYLDELGQGRPAQNHVVLYRELLASHGLDVGERLDDEHFTQGAIQLALAHHAADFLPEILGFNLGYEQLPSHLPITAYELNELDIDPYYFTLHVTIDNAASGHARQALDGLLAAWPRIGDSRDFLARVAAGYKLNMIGMGTVNVIESFDLDRELLAMLAAKAEVGAALHSDYCRVGGLTVTEWLSQPQRLPEFLQAMQALGWIRRGEPPEASRFWRLLNDDRAPMFGVFAPWEQALLSDWIADVPSVADAPGGAPARPRRAVNRFRQRDDAAGPAAEASPGPGRGASVAQVVGHYVRAPDVAGSLDDDLAGLTERLATVTSREAAMAVLLGYLSPANHPTPAGLLATRIVTRLLDARG